MKMKTKKLTTIGILTALYCVLAMFMKFPIIGNISLDLGYIALAVGCSLVGPWAAFIGAVGCGLESILFSPYGFSISWFVANLIIGLGCGFIFKKTKNVYARIASVIIFVLLGVLVCKTGIECYLYSIPLPVKLPKNALAFALDCIAMVIGTLFAPTIEKHFWEDK